MGSTYKAVPPALRVATSMNEAGLLAAAKNGETVALDTLYQVHAERLFRTVRRITRDREDAEDAVQDSFLRAFLHLKSFDERSTFYTWLTRIGVNSALMILRQKRNSRGLSAYGPGAAEAPWDVPDSAPNPEARCAERERERFLRDALAGLRPRVRRTLMFHTLEDHSLQETAALTGISVSATKSRVFHAKTALRKSKVLRKINEPNQHGLHTSLDPQRA